MNIPFLHKPIKTQLKKLESELHRQWKAFNRELKQGKLKHVIYDRETQKLTWHKPVVNRNKAKETRFYEQLPFCDVADVLNRPGFPGECFICELRLPDHRFRWKHNKLFLLLPVGYGPAFPAIVDCYTSPPT